MSDANATTTCRLRIFGCRLELRFAGAPALAARWADYTATHADHTKGPADIAVEIDLRPGWTNAEHRDDHAGESNAGVVLSTPVIRGHLDPTETGWRGRVEAQGDHIETLDGIASLLLSIHAAPRGEILVHSSAVCRDGAAWLFVGEGGAGKTTIAVELSGGRKPMSVDRTLVTFADDGAPIAHSTPFGDRNRDLLGPLSAPIKGIFFIEQAGHHELLPVDPFEATRLVIAQTVAPTRTRPTVQKVLEAVGRLVENVPCFRLRFTRDDGFWGLIEGAGGGWGNDGKGTRCRGTSPPVPRAT